MFRISSFKSVLVSSNLISVRFRSKMRPLRFKNNVSPGVPNQYFDAEYTKETEYTEKEINQKIEDMDTFLKNIDTTLTPEQKLHVEKIKKKIHGGKDSPRSLYRDVPRPEEIDADGNFLTKMAPNAEALIDFALSKIPPRAGKRGTNQKKRMLIRHNRKREQAAQRKKETHEAMYKKQAKSKRQRILCAMYKEFAVTDKATFKKDTVLDSYKELSSNKEKFKNYFINRKNAQNL